MINDASTDRTRAIMERFPVIAIHNSIQSRAGIQPEPRVADGARGVPGADSIGLRSTGRRLAGPHAGMPDRQTSRRLCPSGRLSDFASLPAGARCFNAVAPQDLTNKTGVPQKLQYCRGKADVYNTAFWRTGGLESRVFHSRRGYGFVDSIATKRDTGFCCIQQRPSAICFPAARSRLRGALKKAFLYGKTAFPALSSSPI